MSEQLLLINNFIIEQPGFITWGGVALIILLSVFLKRDKIKEKIAEYRLKQLLNNIGIEAKHNMIVSDEIDGNIFIEHLILMPNEIFLFGVKKFQGLIFAADKIDLWTQVIGNKSYKFENPLHQLETNTLFLNSKIENSKIGKKVLFINGSEFPKGKPENIVSVEEVMSWQKKDINENVNKSIQQDWDTLLSLVVDDGVVIEPAAFKEGSSKLFSSLFYLLGIIVAISIWLYFRML